MSSIFFNLLIDVEQEKTKTSVETNQAASKLRYELKFTYTLVLNKEKQAKIKI